MESEGRGRRQQPYELSIRLGPSGDLPKSLLNCPAARLARPVLPLLLAPSFLRSSVERRVPPAPGRPLMCLPCLSSPPKPPELLIQSPSDRHRRPVVHVRPGRSRSNNSPPSFPSSRCAVAGCCIESSSSTRVLAKWLGARWTRGCERAGRWWGREGAGECAGATQAKRWTLSPCSASVRGWACACVRSFRLPVARRRTRETRTG